MVTREDHVAFTPAIPQGQKNMNDIQIITFPKKNILIIIYMLKNINKLFSLNPDFLICCDFYEILENNLITKE